MARYKIKVVPSSVVYHLGGGTLEEGSSKKHFYNFRNSLYNIVKNYKNYKRVIFFRIVVLDALAGVMFLFKLDFKSLFSIVKAHFSFYKIFLTIYKKRKDIFFRPEESKFIVKDYYLGKKKYSKNN